MDSKRNSIVQNNNNNNNNNNYSFIKWIFVVAPRVFRDSAQKAPLWLYSEQHLEQSERERERGRGECDEMGGQEGGGDRAQRKWMSG